MRILLDTHVLLWWLSDNPKLSKAGLVAIEKAETVYVSAATAWEIGIKASPENWSFRVVSTDNLR